MEAVGLPEEADEFTAETGVEMSWIVALFEGITTGAPGPELAADYAAELDTTGPVLSDQDERTLEATPYDGMSLPGKCALSPEMELLACSTGDKNDEVFDAIAAHAGAR